LSRSSIATVSPQAGFSIGTYLTNINTAQSQVLNSLLGGLGTSVNLSAASYDGLANTYVTVQQLIDASGGVLTPSNALTTTLTGAQWDSFLTSAVATQTAGLSCGGTPPYACTAHTALSTLGGSINSTTSTTLCKLVSIDGSSCSGGTLSGSALDASLNVLQTLTTEGEIANGSSGLAVGTILNLGVASAQLVVSLTQPPQVAYGPVGTKATSSQINVDLQIKLLGSLSLLDIPITGAEGTAILGSIACSNNTLSSTTINTSTQALSNSVTLLGLPIATITANGVTSTPLSFSTAPPTNATATAGTNPKTVGTSAPTLSLGGLNLVNQLLLGTTLINGITNALGPVLQALGVSVAGAQVADLSTDCAAVSLAQ
jgi:uncharacterized membrane protein